MKTARIGIPTVGLIILIVAVTATSILGYRSWARHPKAPRILVEKDSSDIASLKGSQMQGSYDPFFNRVNFTRDVNLPGTNVLQVRAQP